MRRTEPARRSRCCTPDAPALDHTPLWRMAAADVVAFAPDLWVGASVHSSQDAQSAKVGGARWIVVGHATGDSTAGQVDRGAGFIERLAADPALPVIAIGGVRPEDVPRLVAAGAYGVAVIRGVWNANDAGAAVIEYLSAHAICPRGWCSA